MLSTRAKRVRRLSFSAAAASTKTISSHRFARRFNRDDEDTQQTISATSLRRGDKNKILTGSGLYLCCYYSR
jgi:hypothetical protein